MTIKRQGAGGCNPPDHEPLRAFVQRTVSIPSPLLQVWVQVLSSPCICPVCAAMHVCLQYMYAAMKVCSHSLLRASAMRGCALLPSSDMCAGSLGDAAHESRHPGDAREGAAADSLSAAGRACTAVAYALRTFSQREHIGVCRAYSAQVDRQGRASRGRGWG